MARPHKLNADYFSHDADMRNNIKVKALRNKFGLTGYAIWCMLLESLTEAEMFQIDADTLSIELLSADFGVESETLSDVIEYCVKLGLLSKVEGEVITCPSLYERLESVLRRKVFELLQQKPKLLQQKPKLLQQKLDKNEVIAELMQQKPKLLQQKLDKNEVIAELMQQKPQFPSLSFNLFSNEDNESKDKIDKENKGEKKNKSKEKTVTRQNFIKPTLEEVQACFNEKGRPDIDAQDFINYYEKVGWIVGRAGKKMASWRHAVAEWIRKDKDHLEERKHTLIQDDTDYGRFNRWLLANTPYVAGHFDSLLSENQFRSLKFSYGTERLTDVLYDLENRHDWCDKCSDLNTTLINWLNKDNGN